MAGERASPPVHRAGREEPVFHLVSLRGAGREVANGDLDARLGGELGQFQLPKAKAVAVGPTGIGGGSADVWPQRYPGYFTHYGDGCDGNSARLRSNSVAVVISWCRD